MFREMRRAKQQLSPELCREIIEKAGSGVLALSGDDGYPYAVPLSYCLDGDRIIFHGAKTGHKADAMKSCPKASFCVVWRDDVIPEKYTTAYQSVIVFGKMRIVEEPEELRSAAIQLAERYYPGHHDCASLETGAYIHSLSIFVMDIEHISGKQGKELM